MLKNEITYLKNIIKSWDRKTAIILIAVAILQTISWYYTSRKFFTGYLSDYFQDEPNIKLYEFFYWFMGDIIVLFVIPLLIVFFVFKQKPSEYGLQAGDYNTGLKLSALFLSVMAVIIWFVSSSNDFINSYPVIEQAKSSWRIFFIYEFGLFLYMIAWEFIWRGFMLFGLYPKFGNYAILIQMIPFVILHNGKPAIETFGAILGGVFLGVLAIRTRSIFYCIITHFGVMFCIDFICTLRFKADDTGVGVNSLINLISILLKG